MTDPRPGGTQVARPAAVPPAPPPWNVLAILAFVLVFIAPPGAVVCGHIAMAQVRRTGEQGHGLALAGTILGYALTAFIALFIVLWFAFAASMLLGWAAFLPYALRG